MYSLILKISHNTRVKDAIALARGIYRVSEGSLSSTQPRSHSWLLDQPSLPSQKQNQHTDIAQLQDQKQNKIDVPQSNKRNQPSYLNSFEIKDLGKTTVVTPTVSAIPSSRISRILEFSKLGLSLASASIFSKANDQADYERLAEKVTIQLCKMRGAPLKLAQMLSIQEENLIPAPIRKAFEKARQSAHVIPHQEVEFMLRKNLGDGWKAKFVDFELTPFAAASIGQVHRASLVNGQKVAVKVQYHQVKESIQSDIQNLGMLSRIPGVFPKGMYLQRILKNTRIELMQECDYLRQKFYQDTYNNYLQLSLGKEANLYRVPKTYSQFTTSEVLVSEYLTGIKMKDLQENGYSQELRDEIGRRIMKLTFKQLFQMGIMQSDPNPSNFTYNPVDNQLNLYDFGATHIYKKQFLQNYYRIIQGAVRKDANQIWEASIQTGFVTGEQNKAMKDSHIESIMVLGEPLHHQTKYDFGSQDITNRIYQTIPLMLKNRLKPPPEEVYSLHRKLSGSYLACIRLRAKVDCKTIFQQIFFKTLACQEKYELINENKSQPKQ